MTSAPVERREPALDADERTTLLEFLEYYRATLEKKCAGLAPEQLVRRATPPSPLSLLGLVRHMAEVERGWFRRGVGEEPDTVALFCSKENPDGDFLDLVADQDAVDEAFAHWRAEVELARELVAKRSLDDTFPGRRDGAAVTYSLRWLVVHMIEEYARHCGHADLLRERIDGATGY